MVRTPFITAPMSIVLDAIRFLAALAVLMGHMQSFGLYTGPWPFDVRFHHFAVVVFFVLSGLVIAHSLDVRRQDLRAYAIARIARIVPMAWLAIVLGTLLYIVADAAGVAAAAPEGKGGIDWARLWVPFVFLNESVPGTRPIWNNAYWSLAYEVWFYALFAAASFSRGRQRILWLGLLAMLAGWRILLLLPIWLMGVALARRCGNWRPTGPRAFALAVAAAALLTIAIYGCNIFIAATEGALNKAGFGSMMSRAFVADHLFGLGFALLLVLLRPIAERHAAALERWRAPATFGAGFSFSLYIFHYPLVMLLAALGWGAGGSPAAFAAMVLAFLVGAAALAELTEKRTPYVKRWLERRWQPARVPEQALPA